MSFLEDVERSQIRFVVDENVFVRSVGRIDSNDFLVNWIDVIEATIHDGDAGWLGHRMILFAADDRSPVRSVQIARFDLGVAGGRKVKDLLLDVYRQKLGSFKISFDDDFGFGAVHVCLANLGRNSVAASVEPEHLSGVRMKGQGDRLSDSGFISASGIENQHPVFQLSFDANETDLGGVDVADVEISADPVEGDAVGGTDDAGVSVGEKGSLLAATQVRSENIILMFQ